MKPTDAHAGDVEKLFKAMQTGPEAVDQMMELFADDAVLIEPFSGEPRVHEGTEAIRACFVDMGEPPPEMQLIPDRLERDGERLRVDWTCTSPVFPTPMRGYDMFTFNEDLITRLEVVVTEAPPMDDH